MFLSIAAFVGAVWLLLHGLWWQLQLEPTTENQEQASAGRWLLLLGIVAVVLSVAGLTWLRRRRLLLAAAALLLVPGGELWAQQQTSPPGEVVAQVEAFVAPPSFGKGDISDSGRSGEIQRWWTVDPATAVEEACAQLETSFRRWADDGSVAVDLTGQPCYLTGTRDGAHVDAQVLAVEARLSAVLSYRPLDQ